VSAFVLQAGRLQHPAGPLRMIVPPVLAFPLFVLSAWYLDQAPLNPQDNSMQVAAAQLMMLGMLLLLAPVPLHGVQPTAMQSAPPVVAALVLLLYQFTVVHLYFGLQVDYPFLLEFSSLPTWFAAAGAATAIWGGIAAAGTNHAGRLWGYAALHDWGLLIMIMGIPGPATLPLALFVLKLRAISMLTTAAGLSVLEQHAGGLEPRRLQGAGTRLPWNSAAVLLGGLGLAGFPLSAGFTGHWAAIQVIANVDWRPAVLVLLASGGAIFGFIRLARTLFGPLDNRALVREQPMSALVAVVALLLSVGLAVAPQLLDQPIARALLAFGG
jgi:multicomponent Na+:H+ antiporter subunit D